MPRITSNDSKSRVEKKQVIGKNSDADIRALK